MLYFISWKMFLLFSDDKIFDCVSFLTFGVSPIPSVVFTLLNCHVSQKVQMMSCFWLLALFYIELHCKVQNKTEYFANYIHLHTPTHIVTTSPGLYHPSRYWICVLLCFLLHKGLLSITVHHLVIDVLKCYHSIFKSCSLLLNEHS